MSISFISNSRLVAGNVCIDSMSEPQAESNKVGVYLGNTWIYRTPFYLDTTKLVNPHIIVLGMSGSGKTYFLKGILARSRMYNSSNVLVIDWNGEYKNLISFLNGKTLRLGVDSYINLFELFGTKNRKGIRAVLDAMDHIVKFNDKERTVTYRALLNASKAGALINLKTLIKILNTDSEGADASAKLQQLVGNPIFAERTCFDARCLTKGVTSIDLSNLSDDEQRGAVAKAVLSILIRIMHQSKMIDSTSVLVVLDEGWRMLGNAEEVSILFREGRKYGFGLAIATQLAKDVNNEAMANAAFIALFKLQSSDDYDLLTKAGIISCKDVQTISELNVGSCMVRLAEKESSGTARKFRMRRIEGVRTEIYDLTSDCMNISLSGKKFTEETEKLAASAETRSRIIDFANENGRNIDLIALIKLMFRLSMKRIDVVPYLKALGVDDLSIMKACEAAGGIALELM